MPSDASNSDKCCFGIYCIYSDRFLHDFNSHNTIRNNKDIKKIEHKGIACKNANCSD